MGGAGSSHLLLRVPRPLALIKGFTCGERMVCKVRVLDTIMYQGHAHDRVQAQAQEVERMGAGAHPLCRKSRGRRPGSHPRRVV